jgi:hypothetical protein
MSPVNCRTCCVLLAPPGQRDEAHVQLDRRGWTTQAVDAPLRALAELCLLERSRDSRRAWGHGEQEGLALVVVSPPSWLELDRLVSAARRYVPLASLWELQDGTMSPLSPAAPVAQPELVPPDDEVALPPPISREEIAMLLEGELHQEDQP